MLRSMSNLGLLALCRSSDRMLHNGPNYLELCYRYCPVKKKNVEGFDFKKLKNFFS